MNNENQPQFEHDLAGATEPEEIDVEKVEIINNPALSLRFGLAKLYGKYLDQIKEQLAVGLINENKFLELTARIDRLSLADLGCEISKEIPLEIAKKIMGPNMCFGPDEVRKAGIEIREDVPPVPFTSRELERAKELGHMLIYRTSTTTNEFSDAISKLVDEGKSKLLYDIDWYAIGDFFNSEKIQLGWALVSKELTPGSTNKNYLEQSEFLAEYLQNEVFKGKPLPPRYQEAIDELNARKENIRFLADSPDEDIWGEESQMLVNLRINQFFRQSPAEVAYDSLVHFQNTGKRLHENDYVSTSTLDYKGHLLFVGRADAEGACITRGATYICNNEFGVSFSRRGADLKS